MNKYFITLLFLLSATPVFAVDLLRPQTGDFVGYSLQLNNSGLYVSTTTSAHSENLTVPNYVLSSHFMATSTTETSVFYGNVTVLGTLTATVAGDGTFSTTSANWWLNGALSATSTTGLAEGNNLYWTQTRFDTALTATTTLPKITTLNALSITKSQVSDFGTYESVLTFNNLLTRSGNTIVSSTSPFFGNMVATGTVSITGLTNLAGFISSASSTVANNMTLTGTLFASSTLNVTGTVTLSNLTTAGQVYTNSSGLLSSGLTAFASSTPSNPIATTTLTAQMVGEKLAITPTKTGRTMIVVTGDVTNSTIGDGANFQIKFGTGTAPPIGTLASAAIAGTTAGSLMKFITSTIAGKVPFTLNAIVNMTVNTAYWIDISEVAVTGGTIQLGDVSMTAYEF